MAWSGMKRYGKNKMNETIDMNEMSEMNDMNARNSMNEINDMMLRIKSVR